MELKGITREWDSLKKDAAARAASAAPYVKEGKIVDAKDAVALLEAVIKPGDKVNIEGNNQKQADFLAKTLCQVDPGKVHDLHMVQSVLTLPEHLDVFEKGIAKKLDMSFSGPQAGRIAEFLKEGKLELGAIHTYLELYGRYFVDLTPRVALIAATKADRHGNLFTGFSTEDTPAIVEATKFRQGIVIAQVNEIVDELPRVDIPGDWVDYVIQSPKPFYIEPLFTRDPALITDAQVLKGMMAIKGIYGEYGIKSLNHGIGFDTAAIELLLPTYGEELGLKGKICTNFTLDFIGQLYREIESFKMLKVEVVPAGKKYTDVKMLTKGKLLLAGGWAVGQMIEGLERGVDCFMPTAMHEIYVRIYTLFQEGHKTAARELFERILPILSYSNQHLDISIHFFKEMMYSLGIYETNMVREPIIALDAINHKITDELIERYKVIRDSL